VDSGQSSVTNSYTANALNQYSSILCSAVSASRRETNPIYDPDGNMLTNATHAFTWDAENRLLVASNLTTAVVCNFIYDHQSRRISKTTLTPNPSSSLTSEFTYDGWNLISEVADDQTTATTNIYVWGLDLSGTLQGAGGVGGLLSQTIITPTTASSYFPLADANGNCVSFIDEAGNVQAHYTYDAFGNTVSQTGAMAADFHFRFSGKYLDDETGLYYYGYRYMSPALGRWMNRDPIGIKGGLNEFGCVGNDGVNKWDLLGKIANLYRKYKCKNCPDINQSSDLDRVNFSDVWGQIDIKIVIAGPKQDGFPGEGDSSEIELPPVGGWIP